MIDTRTTTTARIEVEFHVSSPEAAWNIYSALLSAIGGANLIGPEPDDIDEPDEDEDSTDDSVQMFCYAPSCSVVVWQGHPGEPCPSCHRHMTSPRT